jgi:hypothetical protein
LSVLQSFGYDVPLVDIALSLSRRLPMSRTYWSMVIACLLYFSATIGTAAEPFVIHGNGLKPKQPQFAVNRDNALHLVFGSGSRIYHCASTDGGASFTRPVAVGGARFLSLGMRRGPRVAVAGDNIVVTAIGGELGGGRDGDVFAWRSTDNGKTWQGPSRVNDVDASAREGLHAMTASPAGIVYCTWLDLRNKHTEIMGASSRDGGKTWSDNTLVYRSPDGSVCECCHPSATFSPDGTLFVMWRNSLAGNRDMYVARSKDNGQSFGPAEQLGTKHWQLGACPMDGGAIGVDAKGVVHTAWRREKTVFTTSGAPAADMQLAAGEQPWLAMTEHGPTVAWIASRPGELFVKLPWSTRPTSLAAKARDPVLTASPGGVLVAWEADRDGEPEIRVQRLKRDPAATFK